MKHLCLDVFAIIAVVSVACLGCGKGGVKLFKIMTVYWNHVKTERFKLFIMRGRIHDLVDRAIDLQAVPIDDNTKVVNL